MGIARSTTPLTTDTTNTAPAIPRCTSVSFSTFTKVDISSEEAADIFAITDKKLSPELLALFKEISERPDYHLSKPFAFYPRGYPSSSSGFGVIFTRRKRKDWSWKKK